MSEKKGYRETDIDGQPLRPESLMMGYGYDPLLSEGALKTPIFQTSTFVFRTAEEGKAFFELAYGLREQRPAEEPGLIYSRINNPDLEVLEDRLCLWDGAESGLTFSSGMAAIATTLLTFLRPGDVIVHSEPVYGGTEFLLEKILPQFGITRVGFLAGERAAAPDAVERARKHGPVRMLYAETPANPTSGLVDIAQLAELARSIGGERRAVVAVDNTFLGPIWQKPLDHGADLVLYSLTKYVGGHSDVIAGACLGREELIASVRGMRTILGTISDPWTGWLLMRSLETLRVRLERQVANANAVAMYLAHHPRVERVHYLEFLDHADPQYAIYRRQCTSAGATFSFELRGGEAEAFRFLNSLKLIRLAVSLGGTESLAEHPATMTHSDIPPERQRRIGITPGMVRLSVGLEHPHDLIADLGQALAEV